MKTENKNIKYQVRKQIQHLFSKSRKTYSSLVDDTYIDWFRERRRNRRGRSGLRKSARKLYQIRRNQYGWYVLFIYKRDRHARLVDLRRRKTRDSKRVLAEGMSYQDARLMVDLLMNEEKKRQYKLRLRFSENQIIRDGLVMVGKFMQTRIGSVFKAFNQPIANRVIETVYMGARHNDPLPIEGAVWNPVTHKWEVSLDFLELQQDKKKQYHNSFVDVYSA